MSNGTSIAGFGGTIRKAAPGKAFGGERPTVLCWHAKADCRLPRQTIESGDADKDNAHDRLNLV
jgi:hypothetical protein